MSKELAGNLVWAVEGSNVTTSKVIADVFGKAHRTVLRSINTLECSKEFRERNFVPSYYTSVQNKKMKCYTITRDGFSILAMGFTGKKAMKWKESYINAFNSMESGIIQTNSFIENINNNIKMYADNKRLASICGAELQKWKIKKHAMEGQIKRLVDESQLALELK